MGLSALALIPLFVCSGALAQESLSLGSERSHIARVELHSAEELGGILRRADMLFSERGFKLDEPVVLVVHGA